MKKQILFKIQQFPHLSETFILAQIINTIQSGYKVSILVKDLFDFEQSAHLELLNKYDIANKIILDEYHIPKTKGLRLIKAVVILLKNFDKWKKIWQFINLKPKFSLTWIYEFNFYYGFKKIDIIHVQYGTNVHPVDLLKKTGLIKARLIVSFHGHDAFFPINGYIPDNGYYQHLFLGDNLVVANTPYLADQLLDIGCPIKNLLILPIPVNTDFFTPVTKSSTKDNILKIISVGRLDPIKGHSLAINFIQKLKQENFPVYFTIVGDGAEYENLNHQIIEMGLENEISLVGKKDPIAVRKYLRQSDIYLLTSKPVSMGRRETQGLATLEAQSCELPVLAFDSGGVKYTIKDGETGFLCDEGDIGCLINKLLLLRDEALRKEMGKNARSFVKRDYSENKISELWKEVYDTSK